MREGGGQRAEVEIRSVNSRFGDVRLRIPPQLAPFEAEIRRRVLDRLHRGRIEVGISLDSVTPQTAQLRVSHALVARYLEEAKGLGEEFEIPERRLAIPEILRLPGVVELESDDLQLPEEGMPAVIESTLEEALLSHEADRRREGERLQHDLESRFTEIERLRSVIAGRAAEMPSIARDRLMERIRRLLPPDVVLDPGRLEQEVALQADRCDIHEELVRLSAHLKAGRGLLVESSEPVGKRFEFLLQEIGRETNTITSKSNDLETTTTALAIKAEIEKLREQIQNVE